MKMSGPRLVFVLLLCALCLVCTGNGAEIINGKAVSPHSMPFMALLGNNKNPVLCGGTLISKQWVLTAAHCYKENTDYVIKKVTMGVHNIKNTEADSRQVEKVDMVIKHPCYNAEEKVNDLMLIKLVKPVKETKTVKVLSLPTSAMYPAAGSTCRVAGWGRTNYNIDKVSDVLRSVNVTVIDQAKCKQYYKLNLPITKQHICAGSDGTHEADSCKGDSGGPLLCKGTLVGVTSFGINCGIIDKPGVYAFLTKKHLEWIKTNMCDSQI